MQVGSSSWVLEGNGEAKGTKIMSIMSSNQATCTNYLLVLPGFKLRRLSTERLSDLLKGVNDAIAESVIS